MTTAKIFKKQDKIIGFEIEGHSGYSVPGSDIVCAAISALSQSIINGLMRIVKVPYTNFSRGNAFLEYKISTHISKARMEKAQLLLETMLIGLKDISEQYSQFFQIIELEG